MRRWRKEHPQRERATRKAWRLAHPTEARAKSERDHRSEKRRAFEVVTGGPAVCQNCGCDQLDALELNHRAGNGARSDRVRLGKGASGKLRRDLIAGRADRSRFSVLCRVCNALEYIERALPQLAGGWKVGWKGLVSGAPPRYAGGGVVPVADAAPVGAEVAGT